MITRIPPSSKNRFNNLQRFVVVTSMGPSLSLSGG